MQEIQETRVGRWGVPSLGQEDPLEEEITTHSSIFPEKKSYEWRRLVGYSLWDCKESNKTERLSTQLCSI